MKKFMKSRKGFTLVELIIVITVLAILAVIAVPVVSNIVTKANTSSDLSNIALFEGAIERSAAETGSYPTDITAVRKAIDDYTNFSSTIPAPKSGGDYSYDFSSHKVTTGSGITNTNKINN